MEVYAAEQETKSQAFSKTLAYQNKYPELYVTRIIDYKEEKSKTVYLTFDDGPSYNTGAILDLLKECNIKATIFRFPGGSINAYNSTIFQELIAEMLRRGYTYYDWNVTSKWLHQRRYPL